MKPKKSCLKILSSVVFCGFFCTTVLSDGFTSLSRDIVKFDAEHLCLAPDSLFGPMVTVEKQGSEFVIVESGSTNVTVISPARTSFQEDAFFLYLSSLIGKALELDIGPSVLKELIKKHFTPSGLSSFGFFERFNIDEILLENGVYHIPYTSRDTPSRKQVLKYFLPERETATGHLPDNVLISIGDMRVILEDPEIFHDRSRHNISYANIDKDINKLKKIGLIDPLHPSWGISRLGYTESETAAHLYLITMMKQIGMTVWIDEFGNTYGRYEAKDCDPRAPPIRIISHLDSVPEGGNYDGVIGLVTGLEVLRRIHKEKASVKNPIELVAYRCEESSRFDRALVGSSLATNTSQETRKQLLGLKDAKNVTVAEAIKVEKQNIRSQVKSSLGFSLEERSTTIPVSGIKSVYEVHAEQGNKLFNDPKAKIAIVDGVAAPVRFKISVETKEDTTRSIPADEDIIYLMISGQRDHSGATPMLTSDLRPARKDALCAAAHIVTEFEKISREQDLVYGIHIKNPSINTVPGDVLIALRHHGKTEKLEQVIEALLKNRYGDFDIKKVLPETVKRDFEKDLAPVNHPRTYLGLLKLVQALESAACSICENIITTLKSGKETDLSENALPVGTIGKLGIEDDGTLSFSVDIRGYTRKGTQDIRQQLVEDFLDKADNVINEFSEFFDVAPPKQWEDIAKKAPEDTSSWLRDSLVETAKKLKMDTRVFHSGAGHDLMNFAETDIALLFVPSEEGLSHNPQERTETEHIVNSAELLHRHIVDEYGIAEIERAEEMAKNFIDRLKLYSDALKRTSPENQKLILGFETDWISSLAAHETPRFRQIAQQLLVFLDRDLPRLLKENGLDNVTIVRQSSENLAGALEKAVLETGTSLWNVIAMGSEETISSKNFRELSDSLSEEKALLVGIDTSELKAAMQAAKDPEKHVFVDFVEMLNAALRLHGRHENFKVLRSDSLNIIERTYDGRRILIFIPKTRAYDYGTIQTLYRAQIRAMISV